MLKVEVTEDLRAFARSAASQKAAMAGRIDQAVRYSGLKIYNGARQKCPVQTGNLRGSITMEVQHDGAETAALIFSNVEYAFINEYTEKEHPITYHEDGTEKQKNSHATWGFFRKSLNEEEPAFKKRLQGIMNL